jgi:hypothetical protein
VREDFLARLLAGRAAPAVGSPVVRIGPIDRDSARLALTAPLAEQRIELEPALIERILDDLTAATAAMAPELGWGATAAVYPPHLQLVGAALYAALDADQAVLTLAHYQRLGGFAAIVGEHLERVLESELTAEQAAIARELFLALVTSTNAGRRATRPSWSRSPASATRCGAVLDGLRDHGLLVRRSSAPSARRAGSWSTTAWCRGSRAGSIATIWRAGRPWSRSAITCGARRGALSLLSPAELRELGSAPRARSPISRPSTPRWGAAWAHASSSASRGGWRPARGGRRGWLVAVAGGLGLDGRTIGGPSPPQPTRERSIAERDLGRFTLTLAPFDWDPRPRGPARPGGRARRSSRRWSPG